MSRVAASAIAAFCLVSCGQAPPDGGAAGPGAPEPVAVSRPTKIGLCVACHGEDGRSRIAAAPHIGGQNPVYLVWALNQYRAGRREGDVMNSIVGALNEGDIEALARWYAARPCAGEAAP